MNRNKSGVVKGKETERERDCKITPLRNGKITKRERPSHKQ